MKCVYITSCFISYTIAGRIEKERMPKKCQDISSTTYLSCSADAHAAWRPLFPHKLVTRSILRHSTWGVIKGAALQI